MTDHPKIARVGLSGIAVTFGGTMSDQANLAAIAFRAAVDEQGWAEVEETASTLVSTFLSVDLASTDYRDMHARLAALLSTRDWGAVALPAGPQALDACPCASRPRWRLRLGEIAAEAGLSEAEARARLSDTRTRIITLGYAPGQPYMGLLPEIWDLPRQTNLTPNVPAGALVIAIRQFVLFTAAMPTGWRHVGQTAFRPFDPGREAPIAFTAGDEVRFAPITVAELRTLEAGDSLGGASWDALP